jgi:hypothetical protein
MLIWNIWNDYRDEKQEQLSDSRDECEEYKTKMTKLRKEVIYTFCLFTDLQLYCSYINQIEVTLFSQLCIKSNQGLKGGCGSTWGVWLCLNS